MTRIVPDVATDEMRIEGADFLPVTPSGATNGCAASVFDTMLAAAPDPLLDEAFVERVKAAILREELRPGNTRLSIARAAIKEINNG